MTGIPPGLRASPRWWAEGAEWLDGLPGRVGEAMRAWGLTADGDPWHGSHALVVPVRRGATPLALRLAPPADAADDLAALRFWAGGPVVEVYDADAALGALLLERLDGDRSLHAVPLEEAATVLGRLMAELAVPADPTVPSTVDLVARRAAELPGEWERLGRPFERRLLDEALEAGRELVTRPDTHACNGDLHHGQVLAGSRRPWVCVDARLLRGDRCHDLARCLWTRLDGTADEQVGVLLEVMADAAEVAPRDARVSALFRAVDYWLWGLTHGLTEDPVRCARLTGLLTRRR